MSAKLIDGRTFARTLEEKISGQLALLIPKKGRHPKLSVILVGDDPASVVYVNRKLEACRRVGILAELHHLSETTSSSDLHRLIHRLNEDSSVDGLLIQLPLPAHLDSLQAISQISPSKDIDGLTPTQQGLWYQQTKSFIPCAALAVIELLEGVMDLKGKLAAIVGQGPLVGAPVSALLIQRGCTTIHIHKDTVNPEALTKKADLIVSAVGKKHLINKNWVKPGAVVIDVGIQKEGTKFYGDVDFDSVKTVAGFITPVPGGVGPVTVTLLLKNLLMAFSRSDG